VSLGPAEILVILVIALLVFGPNRLPEIGRQVGKGVREVRKFQQTLRSDFEDVMADDVSDHAEPAPTLPPKPDDAPAAQTGDGMTLPDGHDRPVPPEPVPPDPVPPDQVPPPDPT
jgi:sec-independent protein translocase protein TatA